MLAMADETFVVLEVGPYASPNSSTVLECAPQVCVVLRPSAQSHLEAGFSA